MEGELASFPNFLNGFPVLRYKFNSDNSIQLDNPPNRYVEGDNDILSQFFMAVIKHAFFLAYKFQFGYVLDNFFNFIPSIGILIKLGISSKNYHKMVELVVNYIYYDEDILTQLTNYHFDGYLINFDMMIRILNSISLLALLLSLFSSGLNFF